MIKLFNYGSSFFYGPLFSTKKTIKIVKMVYVPFIILVVILFLADALQGNVDFSKLNGPLLP
jgi:hypothetical protein